VTRILIVEDEPHISALISYNLEQAGHQVAIASDGAEALCLVESFCPHLVTLDLLLPKASGWQVLDVIRHHPRKSIAQVPVVVLSALCSAKLREELRRSGVYHCLGKPFSVIELSLLVQNLLNERTDPTWANPL
jgi:DNA-binding response OmpR family regulator